ncbi:DUF5313 family protein [Gordonia sp. (in: high G+C Gram-positive bacteria)]|uniref:DUF5313 family protein n=1 Tax=Gordonia sp. (in: high G+C Gram-positive bacteria) TaxID=84139 RepID=UPI00169DC99E|nr:DUF5313 family protein [Gordonia sp. (in: high G+C Gram-positive bacteria)]NLG48030.1 DUF5313 domain-containing protein [Gordonia sp. (in: high G+C Gram-positive bacteria)]
MSERPNPLQWIGYVYGATLPEGKREWVKNDLTGAMATPRHLIRTQVSFVPLYLALFFAFDGEVWIRLLMVLLAVLLALIFSAAYMQQNRVVRLRKHGLGFSPLTQRQQVQADAAKLRYEATYVAARRR